MEIRHRLHCRHCKTGNPDIKDAFDKRYQIQRYSCNACNTKRQEKYRKTPIGAKNISKAIKKSISKYPLKQRARNKLNFALSKGKIIKPNICQNCTELKVVEGHHFDYSKPLDVIWLCRKCHCELHKEVVNI